MSGPPISPQPENGKGQGFWDKTDNKIGVGCLTVFLIFALVFVISISVSDPAPDPVSPGDTAIGVCQRLVTQRLKAPATAEFGWASVSSLAGRYTVTNTVDAENSFGAKLRSTYTCTVRYDEATGRWALESLSGL